MTAYAPPTVDYFTGLQFNPEIYENPLIENALTPTFTSVSTTNLFTNNIQQLTAGIVNLFNSPAVSALFLGGLATQINLGNLLITGSSFVGNGVPEIGFGDGTTDVAINGLILFLIAATAFDVTCGTSQLRVEPTLAYIKSTTTTIRNTSMTILASFTTALTTLSSTTTTITGTTSNLNSTTTNITGALLDINSTRINLDTIQAGTMDFKTNNTTIQRTTNGNNGTVDGLYTEFGPPFISYVMSAAGSFTISFSSTSLCTNGMIIIASASTGAGTLVMPSTQQRSGFRFYIYNQSNFTQTISTTGNRFTGPAPLSRTGQSSFTMLTNTARLIISSSSPFTNEFGSGLNTNMVVFVL